jgi:hypothetical protein
VVVGNRAGHAQSSPPRAPRGLVASLQRLRKTLGRTQNAVAQTWGRPKIPSLPTRARHFHAEIATIFAYIQALGGRLTVEAEISGRIYTVDLAEAV